MYIYVIYLDISSYYVHYRANIYLERCEDETAVTGQRIRLFVRVLHLVMLVTVKYWLTTVSGQAARMYCNVAIINN